MNEQLYLEQTNTYENTTDRIEKSHIVPLHILVVTGISCCLSLFGAGFIFHSYFVIVTIRNYIRKLLLFLTIANVIDLLGIITGIVRELLLEYTNVTFAKEKQVCVFQGFVTSFAPCSSFFWTVIIAVYFQVQVLRPSWADNLSSKCCSVLFHIFSWGAPAILCILALFMDAFGETNSIDTGPWCWIKTNQSNQSAIVWMLVTVKGWELLSYLCLGEVLVYVVYRMYILPKWLHRRGNHRQIFEENVNAPNRLRKEDRNFLFVWLIFYVLRFGGTFRFLMHVAHDPIHDTVLKHADKIMMVWQAFGDTAQAFVNFFVLCVCDSTIRKHYVSTSASDRDDDHVVDDSTDTTESNQALTASLQN